MISPTGFRRQLLALVRTLAILGVWIAPTFAASTTTVPAPALSGYAAPTDHRVGADFNGDQILDAVNLPQYHPGAIVVELSGTAPAVLPLLDTIDTIAAIDIDHDGDLDLGALTNQRKLLIWMNGGNGTFTAAAVQRRMLPTQLARSNTSSASDTDDPDPSAAPAPVNPVVGFLSPTRWLLPSRTPSRPLSPTVVSPSSADYGRPHRGRAPPSLSRAL